MDNMREELRVELSALGPRGRGRAYPKGLLEKLLSYTVARRRQGASIVEVASDVGINFRTLARWLGARKAARFGRVELPAGIKLEKLSVTDGPFATHLRYRVS